MKEMSPKSSEYDLKSVKLPYLSGFALKLMVWLAEGPLRSLLIPSLFQSAGIARMRKKSFTAPPTVHPLHFTAAKAAKAGCVPREEWPDAPASLARGFRFTTVFDYAQAYRKGDATPSQIAQKALAAIEESDAAEPPLRAFIAVNREDVLRQAEAATQRIRNGQALSALDGVPVAVKDEVDMVPYPTSVGTAFLGTHPAKQDSTVVARMRAAGALLLGKTNMHEIGIGVTGLNLHHGTPRNPYNPHHYTGGSSSGSAAAVASGLCPVAISADGGGSIRIPSSFCGLVGLKPTFGRVSEFGAAPLCWSLAHLGAIAATATDAALAYGALAGPDPQDPMSLHQPAPTLSGWNELNLSKMNLGIYPPWFQHADKEMVAGCEDMVRELERMGAKVREIVLPNLEAGRVAHTITIAGEMAQALEGAYNSYHREFGPDVRINLALARQFTARDYIQAQQARTDMINSFDRAFMDVDVILTPATGVPAPAIAKSALSSGESDLTTLIEIMRFATPANLTGLPAISFPAGYTAGGLPIGMQAIGRAWQEPTLLGLALAAEQVAERKAPQLYFRILE